MLLVERNEKGCDRVCVQMFDVSVSKSRTSSTIQYVKSHSGSIVEVGQYCYGLYVWLITTQKMLFYTLINIGFKHILCTN